MVMPENVTSVIGDRDGFEVRKDSVKNEFYCHIQAKSINIWIPVPCEEKASRGVIWTASDLYHAIRVENPENTYALESRLKDYQITLPPEASPTLRRTKNLVENLQLFPKRG